MPPILPGRFRSAENLPKNNVKFTRSYWLQSNRGRELTKPGSTYLSVHLAAAEVIASGLKEIGLMKGDVKEAVRNGAHALFMPHGLGHMLGLDVHDMEDLGQIYVGYDDETRPVDQFGTAYLRMGRKLQPGFCNYQRTRNLLYSGID